ncbi:SCO2583 family membrane protein [Streptacidiphilus carbonis]|uniref:SCO2583 family membrane protein n=1 Tax=Streptacidiphilus carbonis TaxID=105422 RepID=UPI000B1AE20B|nr:hypothetical protein [Streptacidiphilus carbonis]
MGGRAEPPEGTPEGGAGGDDEFRSVVFDESFVRAARIQELSAQERLSAGSRPIRGRGLRGGGLSRQALALMLLVAIAFSAAVYLGTKHPYPTAGTGSAAELSMSVVPLQPGPGGVPTLAPVASGSAAANASASIGAGASGTARAGAGTGASAGTSAGANAGAGAGASASTEVDPKDYALGPAGLALPDAAATAHFSKNQVAQALILAQNYAEVSSLDTGVLFGGRSDSVRDLLASGQRSQFDQSMKDPLNDGKHGATGWLVRFDSTKVKPAIGQETRVQGTFSAPVEVDGTLQLTADHTFVYALTPVSTDGAQQPTVLFTVRRQVVFLFTPADLAANRVELTTSATEAGPLACDSASAAKYFTPVLPATAASSAASAAATASAPAKPATASPAASAAASASPSGGLVDPYDQSRNAWSVCGVLTGPTP